LPEALVYWVFDAYLGPPRRDWSDIRLKAARAALEASERQERERDQARVSGTKPTLPLDAYAGKYDDGGAFGEATVRVENGTLELQIGRLTTNLEQWHYDTFLIPAYAWFRPADPPAAGRKRSYFPVGAGGRLFVTFELDPSRQVEEMKIEDFATFKRMR